MKICSPISLCDSLKLILEMPEMCDVTFLVGPEETPVHGLKAVLSVRSRYGDLLFIYLLFFFFFFCFLFFINLSLAMDFFLFKSKQTILVPNLFGFAFFLPALHISVKCWGRILIKFQSQWTTEANFNYGTTMGRRNESVFRCCQNGQNGLYVHIW